MTNLLLLEWDNFVHILIQLWENLYLDWLTKGKNILVVFYEDFLEEETFIPTIERMVKFMNFTIDIGRLECVSKHRKGKFYQSVKCIQKRDQSENENVEYMYSKKHVRWINSAIRKVKNAMKDRGIDATKMNTYENTKIKLNYCPDK